MSLNSSFFTALSIGALLVACGDSGSGGSGGASGGSEPGGGTPIGGSSDGGAPLGGFGDGGSVANGGASGAVCADLSPDCTELDQDNCVCEGCDATCELSDCVCPSCAADAFCTDPANCNNDNECDPFSEGCGCADCVDHPECP